MWQASAIGLIPWGVWLTTCHWHRFHTRRLVHPPLTKATKWVCANIAEKLQSVFSNSHNHNHYHHHLPITSTFIFLFFSIKLLQVTPDLSRSTHIMWHVLPNKWGLIIIVDHSDQKFIVSQVFSSTYTLYTRPQSILSTLPISSYKYDSLKLTHGKQCHSRPVKSPSGWDTDVTTSWAHVSRNIVWPWGMLGHRQHDRTTSEASTCFETRPGNLIWRDPSGQGPRDKAPYPLCDFERVGAIIGRL